jgi:hypothetical protein
MRRSAAARRVPRNHACIPVGQAMRYTHDVPEGATHRISFERFVGAHGGWRTCFRFVDATRARAWCREMGIEYPAPLVARAPTPAPVPEPEVPALVAASASPDIRSRAAGDREE